MSEPLSVRVLPAPRVVTGDGPAALRLHRELLVAAIVQAGGSLTLHVDSIRGRGGLVIQAQPDPVFGTVTLTLIATQCVACRTTQTTCNWLREVAGRSCCAGCKHGP